MYGNGYNAYVQNDLLSKESCKRRRNKTNYHRYRSNRKNHVFAMTSNEMNDTIGIYEMPSSEAKETFGEDGTCFYILSNATEQRRTRVVASCIERELPKYTVTTTCPVRSTPTVSYSRPSYDALLEKAIHVETIEPSVSSGVGSGESSGLDSPNPPQPPDKEACDQATKRSSLADNCTCQHRNKNTTKKKAYARCSLSSSSITSSRRDSGVSSMSSSIQLSPLRTIDESKAFHTPPLTRTRSPPHLHRIDVRKEILLMKIKQNSYDLEKEHLLRHIKESLQECGGENFIDQLTLSNWKPLRKVPGKSLLKKPGLSLLGEIQKRHIARSLQIARKESQNLCPLKRCDIVKIIHQVRQCLQYIQTSTPLECKFQIHRKIKLKTFPLPYNEVSDRGYDLHCSQLKKVASKGNVKKVLELVNTNHCAHSSADCQQWPAFHTALKKEHFRTAILLIEAGTDLKEYTEQRVKEYHAMMDLVNRNKKVIKSKASIC